MTDLWWRLWAKAVYLRAGLIDPEYIAKVSADNASWYFAKGDLTNGIAWASAASAFACVALVKRQTK